MSTFRTRKKRAFCDTENRIKECTVCHAILPFDDFYRGTSGAGGRLAWCKKCHIKSRPPQRKDRKSRVRIVFDDVNRLKECSKCRMVLPFESFTVQKSARTGMHAYCKPCMSKQRRSRIYGVTPDIINKMLDIQQGCCAICGGEMATPFVDHDHATLKVRGLLCRNCNTGIGMLGDNKETLLSAIAYLARHEERSSLDGNLLELIPRPPQE